MSERDVTPEERQDLEDQRAQRYRALANVRDRDALHDALAKDPSLWDSDAPLTRVAARWRQLDARRTEQRRDEIAAEAQADLTPTVDLDPLATVLAREEFAELQHALAQLDPRDLHLVWLHASGYSDAEVVAIWNRLGFEPSDPTPAALRKRRSRALAHLRDLVTDPGRTDAAPTSQDETSPESDAR